MKIKTLVPVTYNNGIAGQETGLVTGTLQSCNQQLRFGFDNNFMYEYSTESGKSLVTNMYPVTAEETNNLYNLVKNEVPSNLNYTQATEYLYYLGFRVQMAQLFGISESDIEIIID
jgi:hypothetical protein